MGIVDGVSMVMVMFQRWIIDVCMCVDVEGLGLGLMATLETSLTLFTSSSASIPLPTTRPNTELTGPSRRLPSTPTLMLARTGTERGSSIVGGASHVRRGATRTVPAMSTRWRRPPSRRLTVTKAGSKSRCAAPLARYDATRRWPLRLVWIGGASWFCVLMWFGVFVVCISLNWDWVRCVFCHVFFCRMFRR